MIKLTDYLKRFYIKNESEFLKKIDNSLKKEKKEFIVTANPEILMIGIEDYEINDILLNQATFLIPDGIGVVKAIQYFLKQKCERITGIDLVEHLLMLSNRNHYSCFFYGAKKEVLDDLINILKIEYPNIVISGYCDGYIMDTESIINKIIRYQPDIILVALGTPKQEKIINKLYEKSKKGVFIGVGGSFDVISGHIKRAPQFFIKNNLEWLYRITTQPKRLNRFINRNIRFAIRVCIERVEKWIIAQ